VATLDRRRYLKPETIALMASDHIGPGTRIARDQFYFPGDYQRFGLGFAVRTAQPPNTFVAVGRISLGRRRGTFFFVDPKDDMFAICMMQSPSAARRIQQELRR